MPMIRYKPEQIVTLLRQIASFRFARLSSSRLRLRPITSPLAVPAGPRARMLAPAGGPLGSARYFDQP